jgi:hypothetical protein
MNAQANRLSTVAENIANSSTVGYKRASTEFSSMILPSSSGNYNSGGVQTQVRYSISAQGAFTNTASASDLAISGGGFFIVQGANGQEYLTRAGAFVPDSQGNLVNAAGFKLMGYDYANGNPVPVANGYEGLVPVRLGGGALTAVPTTQGTIRANLHTYLPEYRTVVPERLVGYGRASQAVKKEVILCIDQSGSMAASVVYASGFGAVLASMRSLATRLVVFDTTVVDLTDQLDDPVDVLFGTQLGGGTDINRALAYCQGRITRPADTVLVLISDLYEGGIRQEMLKRVAAMKASGVQCVVLLALSDEGAPAYDREHAAALAELGVPAFACTPDLFPEVMAAAIEKRPLPVPPD